MKINNRAKEYNNWTEKFSGGTQQQTRPSGRKDQQSWMQGSGIHPEKPKEKRIKKNNNSLRNLWDSTKQLNICI